MNVLDENVVEDERERLRAARVKVRKVGRDFGSKGLSDEAIIPLPHRTGKVTFFTRDLDYFDRRLRHRNYCLVYLDVEEDEVETYVRHFLREPVFRTWKSRRGC